MSDQPNQDYEVESSLIDYISHELLQGMVQESIKADTPLLESGLIDSLTLLKLVLYLEKRFGIIVGPEELLPENFSTVAAIRLYIASKKKG